MLRVELLEKLERVAPALSNNDLVPILSHFWFKGDSLLAYNDQIAISTRFVANFLGAVPDTIISLLSASRAKDVEFIDVKESSLTLKAASSKLKLPYMDVKATEIFTMPTPDPKKALPVDVNAFLAAVEICMGSLKEDTSMPDSLGITVVYKDKGFDLYATNDATISYARVKAKQEMDDYRVVISGNFCRQMLALAKLDGKKHLEINDDYSLFHSGDSVLFGRLIDVPRPLDFESVIEGSFPQKEHKNLVSVPSKLQLILDRAVIITDSKTESPKTLISVKDGIAKFFSRSEKGEVNDHMQLEEHHPDVELSIDPRLFKAGYGTFDKMLLAETCLVMAKGSSLYLVSASH